jgi:hypothetical protein
MNTTPLTPGEKAERPLYNLVNNIRHRTIFSGDAEFDDADSVKIGGVTLDEYIIRNWARFEEEAKRRYNVHTWNSHPEIHTLYNREQVLKLGEPVYIYPKDGEPYLATPK